MEILRVRILANASSFFSFPFCCLGGGGVALVCDGHTLFGVSIGILCSHQRIGGFHTFIFAVCAMLLE